MAKPSFLVGVNAQAFGVFVFASVRTLWAFGVNFDTVTMR
jgi:hypothetical protein